RNIEPPRSGVPLVPSNTDSTLVNCPQEIEDGAGGVQLSFSVFVVPTLQLSQQMPRPERPAWVKGGRISCAGEQQPPKSRPSGPKHWASARGVSTASAPAKRVVSSGRRRRFIGRPRGRGHGFGNDVRAGAPAVPDSTKVRKSSFERCLSRTADSAAPRAPPRSATDRRA